MLRRLFLGERLAPIPDAEQEDNLPCLVDPDVGRKRCSPVGPATAEEVDEDAMHVIFVKRHEEREHPG